VDNEMLNILQEAEEGVREALKEEDLETARLLLEQLHSADVAELLTRLPDEDKFRLFELLPLEEAADVLHDLGNEATREIFDQLSAEQIGDLLDQMPADEAAATLIEDVPEREEELLAEMETDRAAAVNDLLQYPPQAAGRYMTEKYVRVKPDWTVEEAFAHLRWIDPEVETVNDIYVLNPEKQLIGVISLRELVRSPASSIIREIMQPEVITVSPETDREDVARLVARYDFLAMPVVNENNRLLGIITIDDIVHILVDEGTEDALRFAGVEGGVSNQPYFTVPIWRVVRTRIGWLMLLFVAETFTGIVLRGFEHELASVVALSFFIPLLIGTGGNTGAQTVSTIIRGIALRQIRTADAWKVIGRELTSGLMIGSLLGSVAFLRAMLWGSGRDLSLVVGLTVIVVCTWANTIGSLIPLLAQRLKIDPAVVSAPLITTLVDATGLAIYMLIAKAILGI
jgi:magnesium transporter